jgi:hypothetical protein
MYKCHCGGDLSDVFRGMARAETRRREGGAALQALGPGGGGAWGSARCSPGWYKLGFQPKLAMPIWRLALPGGALPPVYFSLRFAGSCLFSSLPKKTVWLKRVGLNAKNASRLLCKSTPRFVLN